MVEVLDGRDLFQVPAQVGQEEGSRAGDSWKLVVIEENDPTRAQQPPEVEQVHEHGVEAVVAVDESRASGPPPTSNPSQMKSAEIP